MPISPDADYCLMGAVEHLDLTADYAIAARMMGLDVDAIIDRGDHVTENGRWRQTFHEAVVEAARPWIQNHATQTQRRILAFECLTVALHQIHDMHICVANDIAIQYLAHKGIVSPDPVFGRACAPPPVAIPCADQALDPITIRQLITDRLQSSILHIGEGLTRSLNTLSPMTRVQIMLAHENDRQDNDPENAFCCTPDQIIKRIGPSVAEVRRITKNARRALLKGIQRHKILFPNQNINVFLKGDTMRVEGALYNYLLKQRGNHLVSHTAQPTWHHTPYNLIIQSKAGIELGSGCVYFDDLPIIDQIIALTLHVRNRETEIALLRTTNIQATNAFYDDPLAEIKSMVKPVKIEGRYGEVLDDDLCTPDDISGNRDIARLRFFVFSRYSALLQRIARRPDIKAIVRQTINGMFGLSVEHRAVLDCLPEPCAHMSDLLDALQPILARETPAPALLNMDLPDQDRDLAPIPAGGSLIWGTSAVPT